MGLIQVSAQKAVYNVMTLQKVSLFCGLLVLAAPAWPDNNSSDSLIVSHGYEFYGNLTYPDDYPHFSYVNPDAPKGGEIAFAALGTFDSMNPYTVKGRAGRLSWTMYESLLGDGPADTYGESYGLLAHKLEYPPTKDWVIFHLRPEARFSDGTPLTAHDVLFSHNLLLEQGLPSYAAAVKKRIPNAEVLDDYTIKFYFTEGISRRSLIDQVGGVPVWSRKWYEETGSRLDESRLETSPGSGPYVIDSFDVNRQIIYKRNPDYWGWNLPINQGRHNFDEIHIEYFGDDTAAFEAFKAGEYTFRQEGDSKKWATLYDFPKIRDGSIVKVELPDATPPTPSGIVFNLGRDTLKDRRVRQAIALGYNFEWTNESLQYGLFEQRTSFSQNSVLMAVGKPEGHEQVLLEGLASPVPPEILSEPALLPHSSSGERLTDRRNLRRAMGLLDDAGWPVGSDGKRQNDKGEPLKLTFLFNTAMEGTLSAVMENFVNNLEKMGIEAVLDKVDLSQYTLRERERDYDLVFDSYAAFLGTGTGLMQRYGSAEAAFSVFNPAGLASPLVDEVIQASLLATSKDEEQTALRALDRVLRYEFFMIPVWYKDSYWVSYYNMFEYPDPLPPYALGHLDFWWYNADKATQLKASGALR